MKERKEERKKERKKQYIRIFLFVSYIRMYMLHGSMEKLRKLAAIAGFMRVERVFIRMLGWRERCWGRREEKHRHTHVDINVQIQCCVFYFVRFKNTFLLQHDVYSKTKDPLRGEV